VGTVYIGISTPNSTLLCRHCEFASSLSRDEIKLKAVFGAIEFLWDQIQKNHTL
jgi:nicotinamide mononucleotide (NMN) deamidase PncC